MKDKGLVKDFMEGQNMINAKLKIQRECLDPFQIILLTIFILSNLMIFKW